MNTVSVITIIFKFLTELTTRDKNATATIRHAHENVTTLEKSIAYELHTIQVLQGQLLSEQGQIQLQYQKAEDKLTKIMREFSLKVDALELSSPSNADCTQQKNDQSFAIKSNATNTILTCVRATLSETLNYGGVLTRASKLLDEIKGDVNGAFVKCQKFLKARDLEACYTAEFGDVVETAWELDRLLEVSVDEFDRRRVDRDRGLGVCFDGVFERVQVGHGRAFDEYERCLTEGLL